MSTVILEATTKQTSTLIFLHGLGDTGHGWSSTIREITPSHMKIICPTAPTKSVTINGGFKMPSWYDLKTRNFLGFENEEDLKASSNEIHKLIEAEISNGIDSKRILLGGFSQGGGLALYSGLTFAKPLAGIIALSCRLPLHDQIENYKIQRDDLPILKAHGDQDNIIPFDHGLRYANILKTFYKNTTFKTYEGLDHSSSNEELEDIENFIDNCIKG